MSLRPDSVPETAEEQGDGTWISLDILEDESAILREGWAPDGEVLFVEHLDIETKERLQVSLYFDEGRANLDFEAGVGLVTRANEACRSLGPTLPTFPANPSVVRVVFEIVDAEPTALRYSIGEVAYQNDCQDWVGADGSVALPPTWGVDAHTDVDLGDTSETDVQPEELLEAELSEMLLDDTQETDAEFDAEFDAFDGADTDSVTNQLPELEVEPISNSLDVPIEQVTGADRDGRFISSHADGSVNVEAIYDDGTLTSFSKTDVERNPEFRRSVADGRDMLVLYGAEGTLSYIRTERTRRVQVQNDGLVKWDRTTEFDTRMTAADFRESFRVYEKLHRHFAYHRVKTPWRLEAFGFEPYSAMVDEFDEFFDATIFAENRHGDWLVMIEEPGPHRGKIFVNFHQDGLYHLDVLDDYVMDHVAPEVLDDRNAVIEEMPFFAGEPILGGYGRYFAELNLRPITDLLADLRHVPVLDLAELM